MLTKRILVDVELDGAMPDDDVRYHEGCIRRAVQEIVPDAIVTVRGGHLQWLKLGDDPGNAITGGGTGWFRR